MRGVPVFLSLINTCGSCLHFGERFQEEIRGVIKSVGCLSIRRDWVSSTREHGYRA